MAANGFRILMFRGRRAVRPRASSSGPLPASAHGVKVTVTGRARALGLRRPGDSGRDCGSSRGGSESEVAAASGTQAHRQVQVQLELLAAARAAAGLRAATGSETRDSESDSEFRFTGRRARDNKKVSYANLKWKWEKVKKNA